MVNAAFARGRDKNKAEFTWVDPQVLYEPPEYPGWRLVRLVHPDDINTWGTAMGHCGPHHVKWITEEQIWHFFTILDDNDVPHGTIHAKDKRWVNVPHPEDVKNTGVGYGRPAMDENGKAVEWCKSTTYDSGHQYVASGLTGTIRLLGKDVVFLSAENRGADDLGKYQQIAQDWYATVKVSSEGVARA